MAFVASNTPFLKTKVNSLSPVAVTKAPTSSFVPRPAFHHTWIPFQHSERSRDCAQWRFAIQATLSDVPRAPPKILISGAPASGKGTQCELLVAKYGVVHISTGDMLRAAVKAQTSLGLQAKSYMDAGELVPDSLVISLLQDRIVQDDCRQHGWLLDGFPRTAAQAQALDDAGVIPSAVVLLNVPDEVLIERVVGRRLDPETGKIYHVTFNPSTDPAVTQRLVTRSDDTEEKARTRLQNFYKHSQSILNHYSSLIRKVNGDRPKDEVFNDLVQIIDEDVEKPLHNNDQDDDDADMPTPPVEASSKEDTSMSSGDRGSTKGISVVEFVRKAEEAYERGRLYEEDVNWSGQAGAERPEFLGDSTYADILRRFDVALGDTVALLLFAYIGRSFHGNKAFDFDLLKTAAPFLAAWFLTTPLLGCYTRASTANLIATLQSFVRGWAVAVPMGIALRGMLPNCNAFSLSVRVTSQFYHPFYVLLTPYITFAVSAIQVFSLSTSPRQLLRPLRWFLHSSSSDLGALATSKFVVMSLKPPFEGAYGKGSK